MKAPKYPKINSVWKRDDSQKTKPFIVGSFSDPIFELFDKHNIKWEATEKIDGTNVRVWFDAEGNVEIGGKTDKAQLPSHLSEKLKEIFVVESLQKAFPELTEDTGVSLYGEGYGYKIQAAGKHYLSKEVGFILFDVKIGKYWLDYKSVADIAIKLGVPVVPYIGELTLKEAIEFVNKEPVSLVAEDRLYPMEGLVLRAPFGVLKRNGQRIIVKVKRK